MEGIKHTSSRVFTMHFACLSSIKMGRLRGANSRILLSKRRRIRKKEWIERGDLMLRDVQLSTHAAWGCWGLGSAGICFTIHPGFPLLGGEELHADIPGGLISVATAKALKRR